MEKEEFLGFLKSTLDLPDELLNDLKGKTTIIFQLEELMKLCESYKLLNQVSDEAEIEFVTKCLRCGWIHLTLHQNCFHLLRGP